MTDKRPPASRKTRGPARSLTLVERIRGILATRNLNIYKVSAETRTRFTQVPAYHIPGNFYFQLISAGLSPTLHQLSALSQLTRYHLADWMQVFGFPLDEIPHLQATLPRPRTALLDRRTYDTRSRIAWFHLRSHQEAFPPVAPLTQLFERSGPQRLSSLLPPNPGSYLYAKIGRLDAFAFPNLMPGSIVRANPGWLARLRPRASGEALKPFFLVEHSRGLSCCRLYFNARNRVTLLATKLPFANVELKLESQVRLLGILDLEFRFLNGQKAVIPPWYLPEIATELARLWTPAALEKGASSLRGSQFLRRARRQAGLSLRDASEMSRAVAETLRNKRYFTSAGSLSDYEATDVPPRHIHKLFTQCVVYSVRFSDLLASYGVYLEEGGMASIPDEWMDRGEQTGSEGPAVEEQISGTESLASAFPLLEDVPFFLRRALDSLSGLPDLSLRDVFWVGGQENALHPSLAGAQFVVVNRREKKPRNFPRKPPWEQPRYLVRKRDGSYVMASCSLEDDTIIVHAYSEGFVRPEHFQNRVEAEVVGQIVTILRALPSPP